MVDITPLLAILLPFCLLIDFTQNFKMFFVYYIVLIPTLLCTQSLAQISAIMFTKNIKNAMLISQVVFNLLILTSNGLVPVKTMHYSIQIMTELNYLKITHDFIILNVYGLERCSANQLSSVLYLFNINDDMYWPLINRIIIIVIILKFITFGVFIIKLNSFLGKTKRKPARYLITKSNFISM